MEGPRAVREQEWQSLSELLDAVFRPGQTAAFPQQFNLNNRENLRVWVDEGRCVCHVGMTQNGASLFGCAIQVCCIGTVGTLKEYRGRGLASAAFDDIVRKARADGVDLMLVSGDRKLYRMRGCLPVGRDTLVTVTPEAAKQIEPGGVTIDGMAAEELQLVIECYRREAVRFLRPPSDYRYALQCGRVMNRPAEFLVLRDRGAFCGYAIVQFPQEERRARMVEFAGDRCALVAALPQILRRYDLEELRFQVQRHDEPLQGLCASYGLTGTPVPASGTVKVVNFPQLMQRLRPRWVELLGPSDAARLGFWQRDGGYGFRFGDEEMVTDRDTTTRLLFGTVDRAEPNPASGALREALDAILPIPTLWYGLNYV